MRKLSFCGEYHQAHKPSERRGVGTTNREKRKQAKRKARDQAIARDLAGLVGELSSMKGDATQWLEGAEYETLRQRLEITHAAAEAALVEARRRVRIDEGRGR